MRNLIAASAIGLALALPSIASAYPTAWLRSAHCIHHAETGGSWASRWHLTRDWLGRPSVNRGGMQINVATWRSYAPRGWPRDPASASRAAQLVVAWRIWRADGWSPWSTHERCGV